jgi:four helix bundle protein
MKQENWRFLVAGLNVVNPRAVDRHVLGGEGWRGCGWHRRIDQRDYKRESRNLTENFHKAALFALTSQMRRAAISIPANIAEVYKKPSKPDKLRLLNVAQGSLEELRYSFILSEDLGYGDTSAHAAALEDVSKLLTATCLESNGILNLFLHFSGAT